MEKNTQRNRAYLMLKLISVLIKREKAPESILQLTESEKINLLNIAKAHSLYAITAAALQYSGSMDDSIKQISYQAIRKNILLEREYNTIKENLSAQQIHYLPLKGIDLKQMYPKPWMREMSDIDILAEEGSYENIRILLEELGYTTQLYAKNNEDVYHKKPFFTVEIHRTLFDPARFPIIQSYFDKKEYHTFTESPYHWRMTETENYIYLIAHLYMHYSTAGSGLRSLLDIRLFLDLYADKIDFTTVESAAEIFGADGFEKKVRHLSYVFLQPDEMTEEEKNELDYFIFSGTYGTKKQFIRNRVTNAGNDTIQSKLKYIKRRFHISEDELKKHPFCSKHPRLQPLIKIPKLLKAVFTKPRTLAFELKEILQSKQPPHK